MKYAHLLIYLIVVLLLNFFISNYDQNIYGYPTSDWDRHIFKLLKTRKNNDMDYIFANHQITKNKNKKNIHLFVNGFDAFGNKKNLCKTLRKYEAITIAPKTLLLPEEYDTYKNDFFKTKTILKTNSQRQEGLFVSSQIQPYNFIENEEFIVAQEYLLDSLSYKNYKITFRIWTIIKITNNNLNTYLFNDGLVYYAAIDDNIASFYDSSKLYDNGYPMTIQHIESILSKNIFANIIKLINKLNDMFKKELLIHHENKNENDDIYAEIYGIDIHVDNNLNCYLLEINTGPGMVAHNNTDEQNRLKMLNGFIDIIHSDNNDNFYVF